MRELPGPVLERVSREDAKGARENPESPTLDVQRQGMGVVVSWPANQIGFNLENAASSDGPWQPALSPPDRVGTCFVSANSAGGGTEFYRLKWEL